MIDIVTGELVISCKSYIFEEDALAFEDHFVLCIDIFPIDGIPATDVLRFKDFHEALKVYLLLFLHCDWVKNCELTHHVSGVPKLLTVCRFRRTKEFKNFLPLPLDKPRYYYYNKAVLEDLFTKRTGFAKTE